MRIVGLLCATAITVGSAQAQQQPRPLPNRPVSTEPAGSLSQDSLRLTRSDAIRLALARNPQLEIVRLHTQQEVVRWLAALPERHSPSQ